MQTSPPEAEMLKRPAEGTEPENLKIIVGFTTFAAGKEQQKGTEAFPSPFFIPEQRNSEYGKRNTIGSY